MAPVVEEACAGGGVFMIWFLTFVKTPRKFLTLILLTDFLHFAP